MRDVTDAKRRAYAQATSRVIDKQSAIKEDLMLCVREDQHAIAEHIIDANQLIDVVDIRGIDNYKKLLYIK